MISLALDPYVPKVPEKRTQLEQRTRERYADFDLLGLGQGDAIRVQQKHLEQESMVDIPPEPPKPVDAPPPKSPPPAVLFVLPNAVLPVEPKPVPRKRRFE
jgi:hypothetical protein